MLTFTGFHAARRSSAFDLPQQIDQLVGTFVRDGDVLVVSSKYVAISEGRVVSLDSVKLTDRALVLSRKYGMPAELCQLVLQESDEILGGVHGFLLTLWNGLLTPNAGIDKSNIEHGKVVLYPKDPRESADNIAKAIQLSRGVRIGVVISDSRLMPTRMGTVGVAIAAAGVQAVRDMRGHPDLFGQPLRVTRQAIADDLCSGAQLVMGEADEATPIVLVRGMKKEGPAIASYSPKDLSVPKDQDLFMSSLGYQENTDR